MKTRMTWVAALAVVLASPAAAQIPIAGDPNRVQVTRQELEELLAQLDAAAESGGYSTVARSRARDEARMVRQRLEEGDFQTGDRVVLTVRNEEQLTDTFVVTAGQILPLPLVGDVPLRGILRSELEEHLKKHLAKIIRDPEVRAHSLMRVTVRGQVTNPGFHTVQAQALVGDVLMIAGGPTQNGDVTSVYIERQGRKIWEGPNLEEAMVQGRTLDQMSIRAGDHFVVPEARQGQSIGRTLLYVVPPIVSLLVAITQLR